MKKNLFYLFALICSMSLFTACSDDDDDKVVCPVPQTEFTVATGLNLTYNGGSMLGKKVTLLRMLLMQPRLLWYWLAIWIFPVFLHVKRLPVLLVQAYSLVLRL